MSCVRVCVCVRARFGVFIMAASLKGVFRSLKLLVEQNPTVITACGTAASFYAGWLGHSARQKHQAELEQMIVRLQDRLREVRTSEDPYSGVSLITKSFLDWKYLFSITVPMSLASAGVCLLLGYRTGVPVGIAAARAAIPSTEKELNRIRSRARILVLHSRRHMHRRENEVKTQERRQK